MAFSPVSVLRAAPEPEVNAVSLNTKIPEFWIEQPRLWFHQLEAILTPQKISEENRYLILVAKLGKNELRQISDILNNPPAENKYLAVKTRLLQVYEESETQQLQQLLGELELGDQKPSQLLRRMRELAIKKLSDETLKILWLGRLPQTVRAVLTVCEVQEMDKLAQIADKVLDTTRANEVTEIKAQVPSAIEKLTRQVEMLQLEIAGLQREPRGRERSFSRNRQASTSRNHRRAPQPGDQDYLCWYHFKFGQKARKCGDQCTYNKKN